MNESWVLGEAGGILITWPSFSFAAGNASGAPRSDRFAVRRRIVMCNWSGRKIGTPSLILAFFAASTAMRGR